MNHAAYGPQPPDGTQPPPPPVPPGFGPPPPQYAFAPPQPAATGPEFLAVDRHSSIVVDTSGVIFEINGHEAEFPWPEIRSVHYKASPSGKSLMMAIVHLDGTVYECVVDAKPRELLREWFGQLPAVLGYYRPMG
ncbi:hypothetical protein ADK57_08580 [Streptomyces sp. MMG1533]|uniref:hypothetical protein n=1 Tax=Streptomyces sp. MMG1533 TaxID=1415546 RepID=UPI0006AED61E|nr:hypothetical protein [Streptomyces sp. MMG1533]KOU73612.1 hypothetical protein ADK57_08580 [Streptomyces sp. MMG1533]